MKQLNILLTLALLQGCASGGNGVQGAAGLPAPGCEAQVENRYIAFGDSLTKGLDVQEHERYVNIVSNAIHKNLRNRGVGGMTLTNPELRRLVERSCLNSEDTVTMMVCYNDQRIGGTNPNYYTEAMGELNHILNRFKQSGAQVYVAGCISMHPMTYPETGIGSDEAVDMYNIGIKAMVEAYGFTYVSVVGSIDPMDMTNWVADRAHLSASGQSKIATEFLRYMQ